MAAKHVRFIMKARGIRAPGTRTPSSAPHACFRSGQEGARRAAAQRSEVGGRRSEVGGRRSEVGGRAAAPRANVPQPP